MRTDEATLAEVSASGRTVQHHLRTYDSAKPDERLWKGDHATFGSPFLLDATGDNYVTIDAWTVTIGAMPSGTSTWRSTVPRRLITGNGPILVP